MTIKTTRALSLFSGGLDSICATRLIMEQGIEVVAVKFVSPFFGYDILKDPEHYRQEMQEKYGVDVRVIDISEEYLEMLRNPRYGYGRYFNPCVDCKIFMLKRARAMLDEVGASFIITGEVLYQRPMSQRRDTLNIIERDSETKAILLRPLSAKMMKETDAELQGLVDRDKLLDFHGRGRSRQIGLAKHFGITDFPAPAGGCILADPILSRRIAMVYSGDFIVSQENMSVTDILLMLIGRQFILPGSGWLILGRDEKENRRLEELKEPGDIRFDIEKRPGPTALIRRAGELYRDNYLKEQDVQHAASLVSRYAKKVNGQALAGCVIVDDHQKHYEVRAEPAEDDIFESWKI